MQVRSKGSRGEGNDTQHGGTEDTGKIWAKVEVKTTTDLHGSPGEDID